MRIGNAVALNAHFKRAIVASLLTLGLTAAAAAFALGFTGALTQSLADPASAPRLRAVALDRLDESLGYGGFLKTYRAFLLSGDRGQAADLRRSVDDAEASLSAFSRASVTGSDRDYAASLSRLEAPFRRAAMFGTGAGETLAGLAPAEQLERNYASLKRTIAAAADAATFDRVEDLTDALVWSQVTSVGALAALSAVLFALAWFLREELIAPLARLRRSLAAAAAGVESEIWGTNRDDEIGSVARAAERLREHAPQSRAAGILPQLHLEVMERLAKGAVRLESDLSNAAATSERARRRIEQASLSAADASRGALEAASLARAGATRLAEQSEERLKAARHQSRNVIDALVAAVARLSDATARWEGSSRRDDHKTASTSREARPELGDADTAAVLASLAGGLDALETFTRERRSMAEDQLVAVTSALLQAVDRLNAVAHSIADADSAGVRAAE